MNKYEAEIPKYLKQKENNVSKVKKKSKHKHHNERFKENKSIVKDYIREVNSPISKCKYYSRISGEELYEKYHDKLPIFFVEDIYKEKYVDLEQNNNLNGE